MSPGDRSYDAIGLLKQIGEHTAATYANAQEILGNETPKALPKDASGNDKDRDQEDNDPPNQPRNHSQLASNALVKLNLMILHLCFLPLFFHAISLDLFMLHDNILLARVRVFLNYS